MTTLLWKNPLRFLPGVNESCRIVIPIIDDSVLENNETFSVVLNTEDQNVVLDLTSATVTIVDNDG